MYIGLHVKYRLFLSDFLDLFLQNTPISNFKKIRPVGAELFHADGRTDMTKLIAAFRNFANAPKNEKERESMHTDRCGNVCGQKYQSKEGAKEVKIQEFMYRDTTNVEPEMYDYTSNWSHWNSNEKLKEKFGSGTRKTFDR